MYRTSVPFATDLPSDVDLDAVLAGVRDDHVSAPADVDDELVQIADRARADGLSLSIVVIDKNPRHDSQLRDLATDVGRTEHGTVLVLSPDWVGTYSDSISRVRLEGAEDAAKYTGGESVVAAQRFVDDLETPYVSWTAITCLMLACTAFLVAGLYLVKAGRARSRAS
ncbi:DUF6676 family protein [Skermania piniformis]|uniref:TPM domain-containing protein n=1 Tax=Skermania pinensis TaxID=39122 RepID=A0ABX8S5U2_9ACTN|nr:DUF6676 family protein [Skermania piniformis]QXQ12377.1 hypothetical protein KV203_10225 [Skermania piniformis]